MQIHCWDCTDWQRSQKWSQQMLRRGSQQGVGYSISLWKMENLPMRLCCESTKQGQAEGEGGDNGKPWLVSRNKNLQGKFLFRARGKNPDYIRSRFWVKLVNKCGYPRFSHTLSHKNVCSCIVHRTDLFQTSLISFGITKKLNFTTNKLPNLDKDSSSIFFGNIFQF